jgi:predicted metal-binding protein
MTKPIVARPRRAPPVFVCRKCLKRSDDAKGIKRALKSAIKSDAGEHAKPARVVATSCFGLCPKRAVVVTGGANAAEGSYLLLRSADDVPDALGRLRQGRGP